MTLKDEFIYIGRYKGIDSRYKEYDRRNLQGFEDHFPHSQRGHADIPVPEPLHRSCGDYRNR